LLILIKIHFCDKLAICTLSLRSWNWNKVTLEILLNSWIVSVKTTTCYPMIHFWWQNYFQQWINKFGTWWIIIKDWISLVHANSEQRWAQTFIVRFISSSYTRESMTLFSIHIHPHHTRNDDLMIMKRLSTIIFTEVNKIGLY